MNGERLRVAREACWLTQAELSSMTKIPTSTISKMEKDMYGARSDQFVASLAKALDMPVSYFSDEPMLDIPDGMYRKQSRASAKLQKSVIAHAKQAATVMGEAERLYPMRKPTIEPLEHGADLSLAAEYARWLREAMGVSSRGPITNLTRACERAGVAVINLPMFESEDKAKEERLFSGFSVWPGLGVEDGKRPIILLSSSLPGDVQRASLAHELAHVYIHTRNRQVNMDVAEKQAWMTGGYVLLPLDEAREALADGPVTLERLRRLKAAYGVSVKFLITYCDHNKLIDSAKAASLHKQYSSRKWNQREPVEVGRESALLFPSVLKRMQDDGIEIGMPRIDVARILSSGSVGHRVVDSTGTVLSFGQ